MRFNTRDIILQQGGVYEHQDLVPQDRRLMNVTNRRINRYANRNNMSQDDVQYRFERMGYVNPTIPRDRYKEGFQKTTYAPEPMYNNPGNTFTGENREFYRVNMPNNGYKLPMSTSRYLDESRDFQRRLRSGFRNYQDPVKQQEQGNPYTDVMNQYFKTGR